MPALRRRNFITLLGGAAAFPLAARAQQLLKKHILLKIEWALNLKQKNPIFSSV